MGSNEWFSVRVFGIAIQLGGLHWYSISIRKSAMTDGKWFGLYNIFGYRQCVVSVEGTKTVRKWRKE